MASNDRRAKVGQRTASDENSRTRLSVRRIAILKNLQARSAPVPLEDLAGDIGSFDRGDDGRFAGSPQRTQISLHHVDLPLLSKLGFVEYDSEKRTAALTNSGRLLIG